VSEIEKMTPRVGIDLAAPSPSEGMEIQVGSIAVKAEGGDLTG
jgi:hypothetical protein